MTTLQEVWELESDNPDICSWLEEAVQSEATGQWDIVVFRHTPGQDIEVLTVFASDPETNLSCRCFLDLREELSLAGAVKVVGERLATYLGGVQESVTLPIEVSDA